MAQDTLSRKSATAQDRELLGKVALITGGSRGIGRGVAVRLAQKGATVVVNYVQDGAAASETLRRVEGAGGQGFTVRADVSRPEDISAMVAQVHDKVGTVDIFVNNALSNLLGFLTPPMAVTLEQFDEAFQCQARAFFVGVREVTPHFNDGGRVVNISYWPGSHLGGFQPYFAMGANKAALESMCRYFAVSLAPRHITVNTVCAGLTDDSIVNALPQEAQDAILSWLRSGWTPMGRAGTPADIGGAVSVLCSADAAWITGQTIVVDGGASLMSPEVPLAFQQP